MELKNIYPEVWEIVENEKTKISKKAYDVLDKGGIAGIVSYYNVFWFESYQFGNDCPNYIYNYLIKLIERKLHLKYAYTENK